MAETPAARFELCRCAEAERIIAESRRVDPGKGFAIEFIQVDAANRRRIKDYISRSNPESISPAGRDDLE